MSNRRPSLLYAPLLIVFLIQPQAEAQPSLREKIGQMIMVTFDGDSLEASSLSLDTLKADLDNNRIAGVIFFNWSDNLRFPDQIRHLTDELQARSAVPLLIATDQEGGAVARLNGSNGFLYPPSAAYVGTDVNTETYTRSWAALMADWLQVTGINMNLAPVVDVNVNPTSPAIGRHGRSFSANPDTVFLHASWFIDEFRKKGIITTLKHFPGHGSAVGDSHDGFTDVSATWSAMELEPFQNLVNDGLADAIMTAHIFNAELDSVYPATLSHATMTDLLRGQMGYDGVIVSDAMEMGAITSVYGMGEAALKSILAGVDILLYTRNLTDLDASLAGAIIDTLEAAVLTGEIPAQRIEESYDRVMLLKQAYLMSTPVLAEQRVIPEDFVLGSYPNPFNGMTNIRLSVASAGFASIDVFDLLGRRMDRIYEGPVSSGPATFRWEPHSLPSGAYLVRVTLDGLSKTHRMMYLR